MKIKVYPEDFIVKEIMHLPLEPGNYQYYLLKKTNRNTLDVVEYLSMKLKTKVGFAGNKDKKAVTEQYISLFNGKNIENISLDNASLEFIGTGKTPISLGMLEGNHFEIILREVEKELPRVEFIENYFDEQRFSKNNHVIGKMLVQKNFKEASAIIGQDIFSLGKKRISFYFHAYQSYLFNLYLAEYVKSKTSYEVAYLFGKFVFGKRKDKKIPLVNFDTKLDLSYKKILKDEEVELKDFLIRQIPDLIQEEVVRDAFVDVKNIESEFFPKENIQRVSFDLVKGSYATIVIKKMASI